MLALAKRGLMLNSMKKKIVAITGGIGSGKSTVLNFVKTSGYTAISCDEVYNEIIKTHRYKKKLKKLFPDCVSGNFILKVDKTALSNKVFSDPEKLKELNDLTHPLIMEKALNKAEKGTGIISFIEVPLLFEGGYQDLFHNVIVVKRNYNDRVESVKKRSNLTEQQVKERIANQIDYDTFDFGDYYVVYNDETERALREKISAIIKEIRES